MSRWDGPRFGDARFAEPRFQSRWGGEGRGSAQGGGGAPHALEFLGSDLLLYIDPTEAGTAFTDTGRTTEAVVTDAIAAINDINSANYMVQNTAANRPLLSNDGIIDHINPDGTNDSLDLNTNLSVSLPVELYAALKYPYAATARHINFRSGGATATVLFTSTDTLTWTHGAASNPIYVAPNVWNVARCRLRSDQSMICPNFTLETTVVVSGGVAPEELRIANGLGISFPSAVKLGPIVLTNELDSGKRALLAEWFRTLLSFEGVYIGEGDSITAFSATSKHSYAHMVVQNLTDRIGSAVNAVAGSRFTHLNTRAAAVDAVLANYPSGQPRVLSVLMGNDFIDGMSVATFLSTFATYLDARRAAGWYVILCTILPRTAGGFNTSRNSANSTMVTWVGTHCDAICDLGADPTMGPDAAAADTLLYSDGTHPTLLGQTNIEAIFRSVLQAAFP